MKKIFVLLMICTLALVTGCGENFNNGKTFVIGLDDEYPPLGFHNKNGEIVGFDVDLAKETARRMGVNFEFKPIDWHNKREEITSGNVDIIWNGTDITDERKEYMIFTKPYLENRQILLVKSGNLKNISSADDLAGKIVGTQSGSSSENYVNDTPDFKENFAAFKTYRNFKDAFAELDNGDVDVLICDEIVARYELSSIPQKFEIVEVTIGPVCEIAVGFRKEDTKLRDEVQNAFNSMIVDGTAKKISEQWFHADLIKRER